MQEFTIKLSPEQLERFQNAENESFEFLLDIGEDAGFAIRGASLILETNVTKHEIPIDIQPGNAYYDDDYLEPDEEEPEPYSYGSYDSYDETERPCWQNWINHPRFYFPYFIFYLLCFCLVNVLIVRCIFKVWHGMRFRRAFFSTITLIFDGILIFFFSVMFITAIHDVLRNMFLCYSDFYSEEDAL